jgi:crossover junction endodeoxyribonuclease RusA
VKGKTLISAAGRQYRNDVITCVVFAFAKKRLAGRLHVELDLFPPDRRKRDIDNFSKAILDGLTHAEVWLDDSQIDVMTVTRCDVNKECPGAVIRIREV